MGKLSDTWFVWMTMDGGGCLIVKECHGEMKRNRYVAIIGAHLTLCIPWHAATQFYCLSVWCDAFLHVPIEKLAMFHYNYWEVWALKYQFTWS